jgi:phosphoglycerate dehydrogenase-like enzyme
MPNLLVNLPESFHVAPCLRESFHRLSRLGEVRATSHNTPEEIAPDLAWADAVFMWAWPMLDEALLKASAPISFIGHIDMSQKMARAELGAGIPVSLSKGGWSPAVAEMALTLILAALRRTSSHHAAMWNGTETWAQAVTLPDDADPAERELTGLSVGIVGLGQVGRRLAELLRPFQVDLHVVDPYVADPVVESFGARRCELDAMIAACDVIALCAAANEGTERLFNAERIGAMRPNAVFVNVARSMLVDGDALIARLWRGDLYAALDVFDQEPLPADSPLRELPNAYLSPHRAGGLHGSIRRVMDFLVDDYEAFLAQRKGCCALDVSRIDTLDNF